MSRPTPWNGCCSTAAGEINSEIDLAADEGLAGWQVALAAEVNLERAVEHWRQQESPFGLIGLGCGAAGGADGPGFVGAACA